MLCADIAERQRERSTEHQGHQDSAFGSTSSFGRVAAERVDVLDGRAANSTGCTWNAARDRRKDAVRVGSTFLCNCDGLSTVHVSFVASALLDRGQELHEDRRELALAQSAYERCVEIRHDAFACGKVPQLVSSGGVRAADAPSAAMDH